MAPSTPRNNRKVARKPEKPGRKSIQKREPVRKPVQQSLLEATTKEPSTRSRLKKVEGSLDFVKNGEGVNVGKRPREFDTETALGPEHLPKPPQPDEETNLESWARKVYDALISGPKVSAEEAGVKAWDIVRSTDNLSRNGPSIPQMKGKSETHLQERLSEVAFAQHMDNLIWHIYNGRIPNEGDVMQTEPEQEPSTQNAQPVQDVFGSPAEEHTQIDMTKSTEMTASQVLDDEGQHQLRSSTVPQTNAMWFDDYDEVLQFSDDDEMMLDFGDSAGHPKAILDESATSPPKSDAAGKQVQLPVRLRAVLPRDVVGNEQNKNVPPRPAQPAVPHDPYTRNKNAPYFEHDPFWAAHLESMKKT